MNESVRTLIYAGSAVLVALVAWLLQPGDVSLAPDSQIGQPLFPEFTDPLEARSLQIVRFDESLGEARTFEVAQRGGRWVIPSHGGYPADAEEQLKAAATMLVGLRVLGVASDVQKDHKKFGVLEVDRNSQMLSLEQGVGTLVEMRDSKGNALARLIIGEKVKVAEGQPAQRFVRIPGQDRVYTASVDVDKLSTKFEDWIERDLLKLTAFDIERVLLNDFSVVPVQTLSGLRKELRPRSKITVRWNSQDFKWELEELTDYTPAGARTTQLLADEELNTEKLNDLKSSLDDLSIVDVTAKPAGLSATLRAQRNKVEGDAAWRDQLFATGLVPEAIAGDEYVFQATNGEVVVDMRDGVTYVLRFGNVAGAEEGTEAAKLNRYIFAYARVNESKFPEPQKPSLPPTPEGEEPDPDALQAAQEKIDKDHQRALDEWKENRKKAADKVAELNARFGPWYYVVSEDVYKKIHLSKADVIKAKESTREEGSGVEAFRELEQSGLRKDS